MKIIEHVRNNKHFYGTVGSLNIGALSTGLAMGWPNPSFANIYDLYSEPSLEFLDASWIESTINVGACIGSLASIFVTDIYGRRMTFYLSAFILIGFWIFLASIGSNRVMLTLAAIWAGLGVGLFSATAVLYIVEISSLKNRGIIGATVILSGYIGVFAINLWGHYFQITSFLSVMTTIPMSFILAIHYLMIESPFYLLQSGLGVEAKISLKKLRDSKNFLTVDEEYKEIEAFFNSNAVRDSRTLILESLFPTTIARAMTMIVIPVLCVSQMLGVTAISDFAQNLIEMNYPAKGKLLISLIDVISIVLCLLAIERIGRRPLLAFTSLGSSLCCLIFGVYNLVNARECSATLSPYRTTLTISVLCIYYAIYALGLIPVFPIVTGEIFPSRAKTAAVGICTSLLYLLAFCMNMSYKTLNKRNSCMAFALFTLLGSIGLPFAIALLPETKGKSLAQIQNDLENIVVTNY